MRGFTIIELMLAMTFISMLLLSIVLTAIQAGKMYNRGVVLRSVNHAGRDIGDAMRRDFIQSDRRQIATDTIIEVRDGGEAVSGRFCLGRYSYIWNTPRVLDEDIASAAVVKGPDGKPVNFVRVIDEDQYLCEETHGTYINHLDDASKITHLLKTPVDTNEVVLALHSLNISPVATIDGSSEALYRLQYTVGTSKLSEINTANQLCKPPTDADANADFCAINQFDTIVRTNG